MVPEKSRTQALTGWEPVVLPRPKAAEDWRSASCAERVRAQCVLGGTPLLAADVLQLATTQGLPEKASPSKRSQSARRRRRGRSRERPPTSAPGAMVWSLKVGLY